MSALVHLTDTDGDIAVRVERDESAGRLVLWIQDAGATVSVAMDVAKAGQIQAAIQRAMCAPPAGHSSPRTTITTCITGTISAKELIRLSRSTRTRGTEPCRT